MFPIWKFSQSTHPAPNLNASGCVRLSSLLRMQRLLSALYSADLSTGEYFAESNHAVKVEINLNKLKIFSMFFFPTCRGSPPPGDTDAHTPPSSRRCSPPCGWTPPGGRPPPARRPSPAPPGTASQTCSAWRRGGRSSHRSWPLSLAGAGPAPA